MDDPTMAAPRQTIWITDARSRDELESRGYTSLDAVMRLGDGDPVQKVGLPSWRKRLRVEIGEGANSVATAYLKAYHAPPFSEQVKRWLRGQFRWGTAWREWRWIQHLDRLGIPAVRAAGFGQQMAGWWEVRSALLTWQVPGRSLEAEATASRQRVSRGLLARFADLVGTLHARGLIHRDLYLCHVFHHEHEGLRLIDLQRMVCCRFRKRRWWIKDLAALNYSAPPWFATRSDRLRFLTHYLVRLGANIDRQKFILGILARTRRMARHDRAKGRILDWQKTWLTNP